MSERVRRAVKQFLAMLPNPGPATGATLLIYHRVGGGTTNELDLPVADFERQMRILAEHDVVSLEDSLDRLDVGDETPSVVITFDDGFEDVYANAWPILRALQLPFTIYLASAYMGEEMRWEGSTSTGVPGRGLTWEHLREMVESGLCTLGNHTHTHVPPELLSATELDSCTAAIQQHLGITPQHFTYPWGREVPLLEPALRSRFRSASTGRVGRNLPDVNRMRLCRVPVRRTDPPGFFRTKLTGSLVPERAYGFVAATTKALLGTVTAAASAERFSLRSRLHEPAMVFAERVRGEHPAPRDPAGQPEHVASEAPGIEEPRLWAVMVTYRRPSDCEHMLTRLPSYGVAMERLIVVDNDADPAVQELVERSGGTYVPMHENTGPAGGIAAGMALFLQRASGTDWLMILDDDNPPADDALVSRTFEFAQERLAADPVTAGVGCSGARYERTRGTFARLPDEELRGPVLVDYIGGGQLPMFTHAAIAAVGEFDRSLFFGFDDAEYGLRLRSRGFHLYVDGDLWLALRSRYGLLGLPSRALRSGTLKGVWRSYYNARNMVVISKRYGAPLAPLWAVVGSALRGTVSLLRARRPLREVALPARGALDGMRGKLGRTLEPADYRGGV